ncbi:hypothetical protein TNCT_392511, partial [Trichonephila clavata]
MSSLLDDILPSQIGNDFQRSSRFNNPLLQFHGSIMIRLAKSY